MNKRIVLLSGLVLIILVVALYIFGSVKVEQPQVVPEEETTSTPSPSSKETYMDPESGLMFNYTSGESGYNLDILPSRESMHIKTLVLTPMKDHLELLQSDIPREGPPTITIDVYQNANKEDSEAWAKSHPRASNIELAVGATVDTRVDGDNAIQYTADGLYRMNIVVVTHKSFAYVISGSYLDLDSPTYADFEPLLASIKFIPE